MGATGYVQSSSDGEDNDVEFIINPVSDVDLPTTTVSTHDALTVTAHRLAMIGRGRRKRRQVRCFNIFTILFSLLDVESLFCNHDCHGFYLMSDIPFLGLFI